MQKPMPLCHIAPGNHAAPRPKRTAPIAIAFALFGWLGVFASPLLAQAPSGDNVARIGMQLEPPILDPTAGAAAAIDEVVYANIFEGLTRYEPDGSVRAGLAREWEVSEDGLSYRFTLHENVKFHDGTDFDAKDVKFSLERAMAEDSTNAQKALFEGISAINILAPLKVEIVLDKPDGAFLTKLAWGDAVMVAPESAEGNATRPIGTGPFTFANWVKGDRVEIAKNPDYWGEPVALDGAVFRFIPDPSAAFAAMKAEDIDAYPNFPAPESLADLESDARFEVVVGSTEGETILAMNHRSPILSDPNIRAAISHAIDREAIIDGAMYGYGTPIGSHFAPHNPAYVDLTAQSAHDPEKAKALLEEAGQEGLELSLKLPPPSYARRGGEIIAAQLREVGVETRITNLEWAAWLEEVFKGHDFDLTIVSHTEPDDIGIYARDDYYFGYQSAEFNALMEELDAIADPGKRAEILGQAQTLLADDHVNGFLFQLAKTGVRKKELLGLWENSPTQANDLTKVRWE